MRTLLLLGLVLSGTAALAQDTFVVKRVPKEGETAKYKLTVDTEVSGMTIKFTAKVSEKVTKVREDGSYTVSSEQSDQVLNLNGQESPAPAEVGAPTTTTFLPDGRLLEIQGDSADAAAYRMANIQLVIWPKDAVAAGAKWEADIKADKDKGTVDVHCTYEFLGKESLGARSAYKIGFEGKEMSGSDPASSKGTVWVDAATGLMLKTDAAWTNAPIAGQLISGKVVVELTE